MRLHPLFQATYATLFPNPVTSGNAHNVALSFFFSGNDNKKSAAIKI